LADCCFPFGRDWKGPRSWWVSVELQYFPYRTRTR
jgi:hypothetical protein